MKRKLSYNVAVVGATGAVGQQILRLLEERDFPINSLKLLSSSRSMGKIIIFKGKEIIVEEATPTSFTGIDFSFFSAGGNVSKLLANCAVSDGAIVIDNTSAYRMDDDVPLLVPEVNMAEFRNHKGIIANPNCSTIQMVVALKPLYDAFGIERIVVSTYQAVSGAGTLAINEMMKQSEQVINGEEITKEILPVSSLPVKKQIAFNVIPQIDKFDANGYTLEEIKMINETKKIFNDQTIKISATCVRVPVLYGHSESVYVEFKKDYEIDEVKRLLSNTPGVILLDDPQNQEYPTAVDGAGKLEVFVGRLRRDLDYKKGLNMWIVSDNLLKGAAWNAVQIAEMIIENEYDE